VLGITDASTGYAVIPVIKNKDAPSITQALNKKWFNIFVIPEEIHIKGGKIWTTKISDEMKRIKNLLELSKPKCKSQHKTFNLDIKQIWEKRGTH
jgi:hypothetical protein